LEDEIRFEHVECGHNNKYICIIHTKVCERGNDLRIFARFMYMYETRHIRKALALHSVQHCALQKLQVQRKGKVKWHYQLASICTTIAKKGVKK
jgi:hypothetical protein